MAGNGFNKVARKHKVSPNDWKCDRCSSKDDSFWVFGKNECCPGRRGQGCGKPKHKNAVIYANSKEARTDAAARANDGAGGKGGGKGGAAGGGKADDTKLKRLEAENARLKKEKRELEAKHVEDDDDAEDVDDDHMDDDSKSKAEWERTVAAAEEEQKFAEGMHKKYPKDSRYSDLLDEAKSRAEEAREHLRELKDPNDQIRFKTERLRRMAVKERECMEQLRDKQKLIDDTKVEAEALRAQIHDILDEMERVKGEQRMLILQDSQQAAQAAPAPVDFALAVESMQGDFTEMFADSALPEGVAGKKAEMEAGFVTMRNLIGMLTGISAEYKAAKQIAPPAPLAAGDHPAPPPPPSEATAGANTTAEASRTAPAMEPPTPAAAAARDGPQEERNSNRERTPPPGARSSKTATAKKTDEELLGPRRPKLPKTATAAGVPGSTVA